MMFFWLIAVIAIVYLFINNMDNKEGYKDRGKSAEEIAGERYARGEISREEYEEILQNLTGR